MAEALAPGQSEELLPKQTKKSKNAFKRVQFLDRVWLTIAVLDCQSLTTKIIRRENDHFFRFVEIPKRFLSLVFIRFHIHFL